MSRSQTLPSACLDHCGKPCREHSRNHTTHRTAGRQPAGGGQRRHRQDLHAHHARRAPPGRSRSRHPRPAHRYLHRRRHRRAAYPHLANPARGPRRRPRPGGRGRQPGTRVGGALAARRNRTRRCPADARHPGFRPRHDHHDPRLLPARADGVRAVRRAAVRFPGQRRRGAGGGVRHARLLAAAHGAGARYAAGVRQAAEIRDRRGGRLGRPASCKTGSHSARGRLRRLRAQRRSQPRRVAAGVPSGARRLGRSGPATDVPRRDRALSVEEGPQGRSGLQGGDRRPQRQRCRPAAVEGCRLLRTGIAGREAVQEEPTPGDPPVHLLRTAGQGRGRTR